MNSLREEIAKQFDYCMGYHEGIAVPSYRKGHRAVDYADNILKLFEKVIDAYIVDLKDGKEWGASIPVMTLEALKEILRR